MTSIQPNECVLVRRIGDGEILRHHTLTAGAYPQEKYIFVAGVYDTDAYLKSRWWQVPLTEESKAAIEARDSVIKGLDTSIERAGSESVS